MHCLKNQTAYRCSLRVNTYITTCPKRTTEEYTVDFSVQGDPSDEKNLGRHLISLGNLIQSETKPLDLDL